VHTREQNPKKVRSGYISAAQDDSKTQMEEKKLFTFLRKMERK